MANVLDNIFYVYFSRNHNRHFYWPLVSYCKILIYIIIYITYNFYRLPFYNELKLLFLYITYPTSDSSLTYVYTNIISPFIKRYEKVNYLSYVVYYA